MKLRSGDKLQKNKDPIYIRFLIRKLERKSNCYKNHLKQYEQIVLTSFCTQLSWNWSWNKGEKSIVNNGSCYRSPNTAQRSCLEFYIPHLTKMAVLHGSFLLKCCTHPSTHSTFTCSMPRACFVDFIEKTEVVQSSFHILLSSIYHLSYSYSLPLIKNNIPILSKSANVLYLKQITNKFLLSSTRCGSLDGRRVWGRMDTHVCVAESLCCPPEIITTWLIGVLYTPV